jgi:hypothetical protein
LSITNATLAIYPLSSNNDKKKNKITIKGKNESTLPTPANIPSITNECNAWLTFALIIRLETTSVITDIPSSNIICKGGPTTPKVIQNIKNIIPKKIGILKYL